MINSYYRVKDKIIESKNLSPLRTKAFAWVDCLAPSHNEFTDISKNSGIELKDLKENLYEDVRPRLIDTKLYSIIIFKAPLVIEDIIKTTPITIFISKTKNNIITLRLNDIPTIDKLKQHILNSPPEQNSIHLLGILLEEIINDYFAILDKLEEKISQIEDKVMGLPKKQVVLDIFNVKKTLIYFYGGLRADREVLTAIVNEYALQIQKKDIQPFKVVYYDAIQLIDTVGIYRDILTNMLEIYLSAVSNNLNIVIKKITSWGALILVPTLISGVYGMNFQYMPELYWKYGYFFALGLMTFSVIAMWIYFKKKDWL